MGKNYIIINGKSSRDFPNLLIEELPPMQLPEKKVEVIEVEGMSGNLTITDDCYLGMDKSVNCKLYGSDDVDVIAQWIANCETIVFSNKPDRFYKARFKGQIDFERSLANNRSFIPIFECQPFGYAIDNNTINITKSGTTFKGKGSYWCEPILKIYGTGTINITVNDTQVTLKDVNGYIVVDTQKKRTYKDFNLLNNKKIGDFPTLSYDTNTVSWFGTVDKVEIIPNWRYLV